MHDGGSQVGQGVANSQGESEESGQTITDSLIKERNRVKENGSRQAEIACLRD